MSKLSKLITILMEGDGQPGFDLPPECLSADEYTGILTAFQNLEEKVKNAHAGNIGPECRIPKTVFDLLSALGDALAGLGEPSVPPPPAGDSSVGVL